MVSMENVSGMKILEKCFQNVIILKRSIKTLNVENCCLSVRLES